MNKINNEYVMMVESDDPESESESPPEPVTEVELQ